MTWKFDEIRTKYDVFRTEESMKKIIKSLEEHAMDIINSVLNLYYEHLKSSNQIKNKKYVILPEKNLRRRSL